MRKLTESGPLSQAEAETLHAVGEHVQMAAPWRTEAAGALLPCEAMPLCGPVCGVASPARILSVLRGESACPMNRPEGCPFALPPSS